MHLVYNKDDITQRFYFVNKSLYSAFKLTTELCACHKRGKINKIYFFFAKLIRNIARNDLAHRLNSVCADLRTFSPQPGAYQVCLSNPPYFSGGPASSTHPVARQDETCPPEVLFAAAGRALKFGGDFFIVHKPEKLAQLIACAARCGLEAKRLRLVRHREGSPPALILLHFRKGAKPGLVWDEQSLYTSQGEQTSYFREVYHI